VFEKHLFNYKYLNKSENFSLIKTFFESYQLSAITTIAIFSYWFTQPL